MSRAQALALVMLCVMAVAITLAPKKGQAREGYYWADWIERTERENYGRQFRRRRAP